MLRRAFALLLCIIVADVLLSVLFWRLAGVSSRNADIATVCAPTPDARPAIVVFFSDDPELRRERLGKTAALALACPPAPILLVGGARPHKGYFGSEEMARQLEAVGLDRRRFRIGRASYDTRTNVLEMKAMAAADGATRLALVSDALHLLRIRAVIGDSVPGTELIDFPAGGDAGPARIVSRANYEAAAWLAMLAPEALRELVFELIGRRGGGSG
jgi:uncharacterized SAM-binding protein YcdF (DUF218 family)